MDLSDALTITALGMGVVFSGLLLTAGLILGFSVLPRLFDRTAPDASEKSKAVQPATGGDSRPVPAEGVGVISAVLEVERRIYHADLGGRLTITRGR